MEEAKTILTGYRPTGKLHLGHWFGNLQNMRKLQESYDSFFFVADWHAFTSEWADTSHVPQFTEEMVLDWLAAGIDPDKCVVYRQSDIPEVAELALYLAMITPMSWLERVPTYKEQQQQISDKDLNNVGFFQYPLLMATDIIIMDSDGVPVGEDQLPHLEFAREITRRFNFTYGKHEPANDGSGEEIIEQVLREPQAIINEEGAKVPGLDGRKMSKSYGNSIFISDDAATMREKAMSCMTDPARKRKTDPGDPSICPLHQIHKLVGDPADIADWEDQCRMAACGCVAHKKAFAEDLTGCFAEFEAKRNEIGKIPGYAREVLVEGARKARPRAQATLERVREAVHIAM